MSYPNLSDTELLHLVGAQRDAHAFAELYNRHWERLLRHALGVMRDADEAKDIVQDIFAMLWEKGAELNVHSSLQAFLFRTLRNKMLDRLQRTRFFDAYLASLESHLGQGQAGADQRLMVAEIESRVTQGMQEMPNKMREVYRLSREEGLSHQEIAEKLNISPLTVKKHIGNALKILRRYVGMLVVVL